jgi:hypothetical protein
MRLHVLATTILVDMEARLTVVSARPLFINIIREVIRRLPDQLPVHPLIKVLGKVEDAHRYQPSGPAGGPPRLRNRRRRPLPNIAGSAWA